MIGSSNGAWPGQELVGEAAWILEEPLSAIGRDGQSSVWTAYARGDARRRVAMKLGVGAPREALVGRELRRLEALPTGDHVVEMVDSSAEGRGPFPWFAMPLADGDVLKVYARGIAPSLVDLLECALHTVDGLLTADVVHRDLQPSNLLVYSTLTGLCTRITDWARSVGHGTRPPAELTPVAAGFAPPQAFDPQQRADVRDDLYSIGAIVLWGCIHSAEGPNAAARLCDPAGDPVELARVREAHLRLDDAYAAVPASVARLVATLLRIERDHRAPPREGRLDYLRWASERLQEALADAAERPAPRASAALTRAANMEDVARTTAPVPSSTMPALPPPDPELTRPASLAVERARRSLSWDPPTVTHTPEPDFQRLLPPPATESTATSDSASPLAREFIAPEPTDHDDADPALASPDRTRLTWVVVATLFLANVAAIVLVFDPSGTAAVSAAVIIALAVSGAVAALDLRICKHVASHRRPGTGRTHWGLLAGRGVIAIVIAVLASQALMIHLFRGGVADLRTTDRSAVVATELAELYEARSKALAAYRREDAEVASHITPAVRATSETPSGGWARDMVRFNERKRDRLGKAANRKTATFTAERRRLLERIATIERSSVSMHAGRASALYRYLVDHPGPALIYLALIFAVLTVELAPALAVGDPRRILTGLRA